MTVWSNCWQEEGEKNDTRWLKWIIYESENSDTEIPFTQRQNLQAHTVERRDYLHSHPVFCFCVHFVQVKTLKMSCGQWVPWIRRAQLILFCCPIFTAVGDVIIFFNGSYSRWILLIFILWCCCKSTAVVPADFADVLAAADVFVCFIVLLLLIFPLVDQRYIDVVTIVIIIIIVVATVTLCIVVQSVSTAEQQNVFLCSASPLPDCRAFSYWSALLIDSNRDKATDRL